MNIYKLILLFALATVHVTADADELTLYLIKPRVPLDWSSPRSLSITSAMNSVGRDYAPIGHFAAGISCSRPNRYGITRVLTGMERKNKVESQRITLREGLGLGSLTYSFAGRLQSALTSRNEIERAKRDGRLKILRIPTTETRCDQMMEFLERWIDAGSYTVYGGGKQTVLGEGAGCADFAMEFFKIATGELPPSDWLAQINLPLELVGGSGRRVEMLQILKRRDWADASEPSVKFKIADTDKVHHWLDQRSVRGIEYTWKRQSPTIDPSPLQPFEFLYSVAASSSQIFDTISVNSAIR